MKVAALLVALSACTGTIGGDESEGGTGARPGQATFQARVAPMLRTQCASCHEAAGVGPAFLGAAGDGDDYTAIISNSRIVGGFEPTQALVLTKGSHAGAQWWSADQTATITSWLVEEQAAFDEGAVTDLMAAWVGCMTLDNWTDSKMGEWAAKRTDQDATCGGCHASGEYGFFANPTPETMFDQNRTATGIASFFQVSAADLEPQVIPSFDKLRSKCSGSNLHPACAVDDQYVEYLQRFHALTRATMEAGLCSEPGYFDPTAPVGP